MHPNFISTASVSIQAPAVKIWEALTRPEMVKQYLFGTQMTTDWKVGSPIRYSGVWQGQPYEDKGQVVAFEPLQRIATTYWSPLAGLPDLPENYNNVSYEISEEVGGGSQLTITQDNNRTEEDARHAEQNWKMVLDGIKKLVEG
jgi:uncharacterized protein YndB with AHSA1/START domain